ncbi:MAG: GerMN domain-containing protein [Acidobacteria bacterium]|nr:GerMN domain-containing protein [Acidobacteriota bacterium]
MMMKMSSGDSMMKKNSGKLHLIYILISLLLISSLISCGKDDNKSSDDGYKYKDADVELDKKQVKLYFPSAVDGLLHEEIVSVFDTEFITDQAKQTINALIKGPYTNLARIIPSNTKLREIYLDQRGIAYIDFSTEITLGLQGGTDNEMLLIYSIVNTLTENFEDIKKVHILVDGREIISLTGHIDLSVPFKDRPDMIYVPSAEGDNTEITEDTPTEETETPVE